MFDLDSVKMEIILDGVVICEVSNYPDAISGIIAAYWAYENALDTYLLQTLEFLAGYMSLLVKYKITSTTQRLLNKLL